MRGRNVPVHYLRPNEAVWTPPAVVSFDTETVAELDGDSEILTLRCWVARVTDRRGQNGREAIRDRAYGTTAEQLAEQINGWSVRRPVLWCYAHNLGFDLTTTQLPLQLSALGWEVTDAAIDGRSPWVRLKKGYKRLALCDSHSVLPKPLAEIGEAVGQVKPPLPAEDDSPEAWRYRCESDCEILESALLGLMAWWDSEQLGRWTITGGGCGWNAFRHKPSPWRIVVDPDDDGLALDRSAIYGGRRQVWRYGDLPPGDYVEADLAQAYATVAATLPLPWRRGRRFDQLPVDSWLIGPDRWGMVAECEIETDVPRWPVKLGGRVWYPVGRFRTTLAGPEIAEARALGCLRAVGAGQVHQLGMAMQPWARWLLDCQDPARADVPAVARIACKHWGRAVIGKWAQRHYSRLMLGPSPVDGWGREAGWDRGSGVRGSMVDMAGKRWWCAADDDGDNAYPAILAYVESYVRVRLGRVIDACQQRRLVQCDTDGLLLAGLPVRQLARLDAAANPLTLRVKRTYSQVRMLGPQHYTAGGERHYSGVSKQAEPGADGKLHAHTWPGLAWQMAHGSGRGYVRPAVRYFVHGPYIAGWVILGGQVRPPECRIRDPDGNQLARWAETRWSAAGDQLARDQSPFMKEWQ